MDLYIIRHAQSTNNALADERQRVADPLLTDLGRQQAELLASHLAEGARKESAWQQPATADRRNGRGFHLTQLYCSPMRRALQTAEPIGRGLGLTPHVWVDIHEAGGMWLDHGAPLGVRGYPGITQSELLAAFPHYVTPDDVTEEGWWGYAGQEDDVMAAGRAARVAETLRSWAERDERIAIVTHGAFSDFLLRNLLGQPPAWPIFYHLNNTSISLIRFRANGAISVRYFNRLEHLPPELIS